MLFIESVTTLACYYDNLMSGYPLFVSLWRKIAQNLFSSFVTGVRQRAYARYLEPFG
jgi:hypothetical protein